MPVQTGAPRRSPRLRAASKSLLNAQAMSLLERAQEIFCDLTRAQIARTLAVGPLNVTEIGEVIGKSKWSTSRHLAVLRKAGLVRAVRRGRRVYYSVVDDPALRAVLQALDVVVAEAGSGAEKA